MEGEVEGKLFNCWSNVWDQHGPLISGFLVNVQRLWTVSKWTVVICGLRKNLRLLVFKEVTCYHMLQGECEKGSWHTTTPRCRHTDWREPPKLAKTGQKRQTRLPWGQNPTPSRPMTLFRASHAALGSPAPRATPTSKRAPHLISIHPNPTLPPKPACLPANSLTPSDMILGEANVKSQVIQSAQQTV